MSLGVSSDSTFICVFKCLLCCSLLDNRRLGGLMIIRSIWRCVRRKRFSSSPVSVQELHPYRIVGVIVPWNNRSRSFIEYVFVVSSCFSRQNFLHPAAILLSISFLMGSWNVKRLPKYFCDDEYGRISMFMPFTFVCSGCWRVRRCCWLCNIFVLSGWSSSPTFIASVLMSCNIFVNWGSVCANSSTSSANRRFVSGVQSCGVRRNPFCCPVHCGFNFRKIP